MNAAGSAETLAPMYYTTNSDLKINRSDSLTHLALIAQPLTLQPTRRLRLKCDGTRAETRFRLSAKRTSPFKSAGASVQLSTGSRGVRISGSNAGYTMFRGSVKGTGYTHSIRQFPFHFPSLRHRVPSHFNCTLPHPISIWDTSYTAAWSFHQQSRLRMCGTEPPLLLYMFTDVVFD